MMPSRCQGFPRTENMDSTFAGMPASPFMRRVDQVCVLTCCQGGAPRRTLRPGMGGVAWSGSRMMLGGVAPADEQGGDHREQVPAARAARQSGSVLNVGLGVGGADT